MTSTSAKRRSIRRHHRATKILRAMQVTRLWHVDVSGQSTREQMDVKVYDEAVRVHQNLKKCSCRMCGNPRRYSKGKDKLTVSELRQHQAMLMELKS